MDAIWQSLWNAGIPLFILAVGIVVVWRQWRADMTESSRQRDALKQSIDDLTTAVKVALQIKS